MQGFFKDNVELGSMVITDGWGSYASLAESGYSHAVPKKFEVADENKVCTLSRQ